MSFSSSLLQWHKKQKRILPWNMSPSPYKIWISEIMLQQTVLASVISHYNNWMRIFPDVFVLAKSTETQILKVWEGLGYYSRAKNILKTAKILVQDYNGKIPNQYNQLFALPGIGDYTACAILSMAFHQPYPVLDANVKRIGQRMLLKSDWNKKTEISIKTFLKEHIPNKKSGQFNEAIMHLGQSICVNTQPKCLSCPINQFCLAYKNNQQNMIPESKLKRNISLKHYVFLLLYKDKIYLTHSVEKLFKGLWLFPKFSTTYSLNEIEEILKQTLNLKNMIRLKKFKSITHFYTKYKDVLVPYVYSVSLSRKNNNWKSLKKIENYPMPSVYRKIIGQLRDEQNIHPVM